MSRALPIFIPILLTLKLVGKGNRNEMEGESLTFDREGAHPFSACHPEQQFCKCHAMSREEHLSPSSAAFPALPQQPPLQNTEHGWKSRDGERVPRAPCGQMWGWLKGAELDAEAQH